MKYFINILISAAFIILFHIEINTKISQMLKDGFAKNSQLKTLISAIEDDTKDSVATKPDDPETTIKQTNLNAINCKVREVLQDFQTA